MPTTRFAIPKLTLLVPVILVLCVGAMLSVTAYYELMELENTQKLEEFKRFADDQAGAIHAEIAATLASIHSIRGLFAASPSVTRDGFSAFVYSLEIDDVVQALEWIPRVPAAKRAEFERNARLSGLSQFRFTERQSSGVMAVAGQREEYFPVYFVEPITGNEAAIGFDLGSNPTRMAAIALSRDSGKLVASSRITLVQQSANQYGFLVFMPLYSGPAKTVAARRENLLGFGLGVYRISDLIQAALRKQDGTKAETDIWAFDLSSDPNQQLIHPRDAEAKASIALDHPLRFERKFDVADRTWSVLITPAAGSVFLRSSYQPGLVLSLGLLFTILAASYLNSLSRRSAITEELVENRTAELKNVNLSLQQTQEQLRQMALCDPLTGLANRSLFQEQVEHNLQVVQRLNLNLIVLMIDLDGFKAVNDKLGHRAGDAVLCEIANRLKASTRKADLVARIGGDEFVIIMETGATISGASILAKSIGAAIEKPICVQDAEVKVGASIGIAAYPDNADDFTSLIHHADIAMYQAKKSGQLFVIFQNQQTALSA